MGPRPNSLRLCLGGWTALAVAFAATPRVLGQPVSQFFDDFAYINHSNPGQPDDPIDPAFTAFGWEARSGEGGPGPGGATWRRDYVVWEDDPLLAGNRIMRLRASTAGSGAGTQQSEVRTLDLRFLEGTYCARVLFSDAPRQDTPEPSVQAFFAINTLSECDLNYAEVDFEYLPNDNFGDPCAGGQALHMNTWETWDDGATNQPRCPATGLPLSTVRCETQADWHTLCFQVAGGQVRYILDGAEIAVHGGAHYPETPMRLSFNHWFVASDLAPMAQPAEYAMAVDWVYHARGNILALSQVIAEIGRLRGAGVERLDTLACSTTPGDLDHDSDVDLADYPFLAACLTGPHCGPGGMDCGCADLDGDYDVDLGDFAGFSR